MNKLLRRQKFFATILAVVLSFSFLPLAAWAEEGDNLAVPEDSNDQVEVQMDSEDSDDLSLEFIDTLENQNPDVEPDVLQLDPNEEDTPDQEASEQEIEEENITPSPLRAPLDPSDVTNIINKNSRDVYSYNDLLTAVSEANSGDTLVLGEGHYSLYGKKLAGKDSKDFTAGKKLTFEGQGQDKTFWRIGAEVPDPSKIGTEYNGDYSFDGADTITFKNMTLQSASADNLGFIRADHTVVENCVITGKTFYWGYQTATFTHTTFNAPSGDYAIWTYSSPTMTFDSCTFNSNRKTINVYADYSAGKHDINVNLMNCNVNSSATSTFFAKPVLNINDSNMGDFTYKINISGINMINGTVVRDTGTPTDPNHTATCSRWFGFGGKQNTNNTGRTIVTIDGETVFKDGKMLSHEIDTEYDKYTDGYEDDAYTISDWAPDRTANQFTRTKTCQYCKQKVEEKGYHILYNPAGGVWSGNISDPQSSEITPIKVGQSLLDAPTRAGYNFAGWKLEGTDKLYQPGANYNLTNEADEYINGAFEAVWEPEPVVIEKKIITYDANGGTFKDGTSVKTYEYDKGSEITIIDAPTREGYSFDYWQGSEYYPGDKYTVNENHNFVAQWKQESAPGEVPEIVLPGPAQPQPVTVYPPAVVKQIKGGQPAMPDSFTFKLEAVSYITLAGQKTEAMPLPLDNRTQDHTAALLQIQGASSGSFGQITYHKPGDYTYKITEVANPSLPYKFANAVYTYTDHVFEQDGKLVNERTLLRDGQPVNAITAYFTNEYIGPNSIQDQVQNLPATGAIDSLPFGLCLSAIGLAILFGLKKHN